MDDRIPLLVSRINKQLATIPGSTSEIVVTELPAPQSKFKIYMMRDGEKMDDLRHVVYKHKEHLVIIYLKELSSYLKFIGLTY